MQEAVAALEAALEELIEAKGQIPDELLEDLQTVIDNTEALLETLREKSEA